MKEKDSPYQLLERIFHEPNRLAIMSALGGSAEGLTFKDLKEFVFVGPFVAITAGASLDALWQRGRGGRVAAKSAGLVPCGR